MLDQSELIVLCHLLDELLSDEDYFEPDETPTIDDVFRQLDDERAIRPSLIEEAAPDKVATRSVTVYGVRMHKDAL